VDAPDADAPDTDAPDADVPDEPDAPDVDGSPGFAPAAAAELAAPGFASIGVTVAAAADDVPGDAVTDAAGDGAGDVAGVGAALDFAEPEPAADGDALPLDASLDARPSFSMYAPAPASAMSTMSSVTIKPVRRFGTAIGCESVSRGRCFVCGERLCAGAPFA
jgi:hypothetical protein